MNVLNQQKDVQVRDDVTIKMRKEEEGDKKQETVSYHDRLKRCTGLPL